MEKTQVNEILSRARRLHFAGIGGISMHSLALWAKRGGFAVTGSDRSESPIIGVLRAHDIPVFIGQRAENVAGADVLIYSVALTPDNPELVSARKTGIPILTRGEFLGYMMSFYRVRVGISGTHGKSTTTAMLSHIMLRAGADPTIACGAIMPEIGGSSRIGSNRDFFIYEACEYKDSFLSFCPTDAVITNVELDHTDYFPDLDAVIASFAASVREAARVCVNIDNANAVRAAEGCGDRVITVSLSDPAADFYAADPACEHGCARYTLMHRGQPLCRIKLPVIGRFNAANSLCAAAVAYGHGIAPDLIAAALADFAGVSRRFERKGEFNGIAVYDDYAHHPDEVRATVQGLGALGYRKVWLVFQPHTYTRTKDLWNDWVSVFSGAKERGIGVILADIFAARETDDLGVSSKMLADACGAEYFPDFESIAARLRAVATPGDLILTMGAGQAYRVGEILLGE